MTFGPVAFLANVERIFAAYNGLTVVKTWSRPTKLTTSVASPEINIDYVVASVDSVSLSQPHKKISFYVRFTIFEEQTTSSSQMDTLYQGILGAVAANPTLEDINKVATCDYFGTFNGREISWDFVATERNGISVNAMKIDVPCEVRDT